ncbi:MAG TPA: sigma-54 dependent transcriptional regulator [Polyangiaceae bacterium]|jgi:DNA-binding NtrC family response regulator|nr:sigma-54 dependent transcriptional regulator [Polyangiaceae bacterium]
MGGRVLLSGTHGGHVEGLRAALARRGYTILGEPDEPADFDVVLTICDGPAVPDESAIRRGGGRAVVIVDAEPSVERTVAALRAGAADYVTDPCDVDAVDNALRRVLDKRAIEDSLKSLGANAPFGGSEAVLLGESAATRRVRATLERLGSSDSTVLVTGESGTGKEVVARLLHRNGRRRGGPFIAVSCAALPAHLVESEFFGHARGAFTGAEIARRGLLVEASGGTLFLDEVSSMPMSTQAKLLRAIQQRTVRPLGRGGEVEFDARIIAASNVDLETAVAAGRFREDLFFRLNVVQIKLPPLRERGLDVLLLAQHFIARFAQASDKHVLGMTTGAARALLAYNFPGNVRELQNWVEAAVALTRHDHVTENDLLSNLRILPPSELKTDEDSLSSWDTLEARHIARILEEAHGNKAEAARLLGIDRKTLYRKLRRYGADIDEAEEDSSRHGGPDVGD